MDSISVPADRRAQPGRRRGAGRTVGVALGGLLGCLLVLSLTAPARAILPTFENRTPVGFSAADSSARSTFVVGAPVTVRVDLNQPATPAYPVFGEFQSLERSLTVDATDTDGARADIAVSATGAIHMAWIAADVVAPVSTPVYYVRYARSDDGGRTFSDPVSVAGSRRFDALTLAASGASFSTVDLALDSRGNPRVVYAFDASPDGGTAHFATRPDNVYLSYSENGGASWLPGNGPLVVNDTLTTGNLRGRATAFPRLAIDDRDNVYITYVRGTTRAGTTDDIMLARVNRSTTPFSLEKFGSLGTVGSTGGVRVTRDGSRQTGPDLAIGTGDVLHLVYFDDAADAFEHKTVPGDAWRDVTSSGWDAASRGAVIDDFDNEATNAAVETPALFCFPTVVVDRARSPNRVYAVYKYGDATYETVFANSYVYDNARGGDAAWSASAAAPAWSSAATPLFSDGAGRYNVELDWTLTEPVAAVVDPRTNDRGELAVAFTAGYSGRGEQDIYYATYNGSSWTLPTKVADDDAGVSHGVAATDVFLAAPSLAGYAASRNLYLTYVGGTAEGMGVDNTTDANQHVYFKVLGRAVAWEDHSVPVGGYQYDLTYTPTNALSFTTAATGNPVWVHVADNSDGAGAGAAGNHSDGFLTGNWETVATTLADDDKRFEGRLNEDASSGAEWGDDDDKIGLLVKLNVLGSDSATNLQVITNSTASAAGTGKGARTVRVGTDPRGSFAVVGSFFALGAAIDIVDANTSPVVRITQPDGVADEANTSYAIQYDLNDVDDALVTGGLRAALYYAADSSLASVQDIRIFGTLIADENDCTGVFAGGTDDLLEGSRQSYTWDDPPAALKAKLFANIEQALSGAYYVYLVADDRRNPPVFTRSPGALTIRHRPIVVSVAPSGYDTVDTGLRSGDHANPYEVDFLVRDFDRPGATQVQLFYAAAAGLTSVSASGTYPDLRFALGKSVSGVRAVPLTHAEALTSSEHTFSWDATDLVAVRVGATVDSQTVAEGSYYVYAVACDSANTTVGRSAGRVVVRHSPWFSFYEPLVDTHRQINTGSQPIFTIQWQKGRGDGDYDDDANIDLFFTTDNPATVNYEAYPDSLWRDADTRVIVRGLAEDLDGAADMYAWDLRHPAADVPRDGEKVWLYAGLTDAHGNRVVVLGGAVTMTHDPHVTLMSSELALYASFSQNDAFRIEWQDYLVDDGAGTDDAYLRLYASTDGTLTSLADLEADVGGATFLINSSNGLHTGTLTSVREDSANFFDWNTRLFGAAGSAYYIYAAINKDATFGNSTSTTFSRSSTPLTVGVAGSRPHVSTSPSDRIVAVGDTVTLDVMVWHPNPMNFVQVVIKLVDDSFSVVDQSTAAGLQPFVDLNTVFPGTTAIENTYRASARQLRFSKATFLGQVVGAETAPAHLARLQLVPLATLTASPSVTFTSGETGTVLGLVNKSDPLDSGEGLTLGDPQLTRVTRGTITATVELEGHSAPLGSGDQATLLDIHLRQPGSALDITDSIFRHANDDNVATTDTVEVQTTAAGALSLYSVPPGRYVLTVKDSSHVSGRTDTLTVRAGESVAISALAGNGFFGSDLRGDPTSLLPSSGRQLAAGDVSQDNEINEDDVNLIIAAWGTDTSKPLFHAADLNNDGAVGAADLTATTSNFGNTDGFGAPPVYRATAAPSGGHATLSWRPVLSGRSPEPGEQVEVDLLAKGLADLAGFEASLAYDARCLRPAAPATPGDVFARNPLGAAFGHRFEPGSVTVMAARKGKRWSASGEAVLARVVFDVLDSNGLGSLAGVGGQLFSSRYERQALQWEAVPAPVLPWATALAANYPNPFNPQTTVAFALADPAPIRLDVYDLLGQLVRHLATGPWPAGSHSVVWDGCDDAGAPVATGVYLCQLQLDGRRYTRKMALIR